MSSRLSRCLKSLEAAGFLRRQESSVKLLQHGVVYAEQLRQQWLSLRELAVNLGNVNAIDPISWQRFSFVQSQQFRAELQKLRQTQPSKAKCPTLLKQQRFVSNSTSSINSIFQQQLPVTQLVTDFYVEAHRGLEHFYNVQRESKIWWMRYSSNPSRYAIAPYDLEQLPDACQAIDIRTNFGDAEQVTIEELSLVPLPDDQEFYLPDARTGRMQLPSVIRSVIELETATCALLLDGCDHGREARSLLLNRVLAPYQCGIAGLQQSEQSSPDLSDLCAHMVNVLQRAQLRLHTIEEKGYALAENKAQLAQHLELADCLGVPYTLLLEEEQSLSNGLMQLRSRDTQLEETIHISDLPDYLLNIFRNN